MKRLLLKVASCAFVASAAGAVVNAQAPGARADAPAKPSEQAAAATPARSVKGLTLTSEGMPRVKIKVDKAFEYAGSQKFILYDTAQVEQFFFVVPGEGGRVKRLVMVQFEGYLPNNTHTYDYGAEKSVRLGRVDFMTDFSVGSPELVRTHRPGSDVDRAVRHLEAKGFRPEGDFMSQRFVRLVDEARRNEIIILYVEDMGGTGFTVADFAKGGRADAQKGSIEQGLLARALKSFTVSEK